MQFVTDMDLEEEKIYQEYLESLKGEEMEELSKNIDAIERFKNLCSNKGLVLTEINFKYIRSIGIVAIYPNLLSILNPNLKEDKEGLLSCSLLNTQLAKKKLSSGFLFESDYMIMAHPYFRRGYNENANFTPRFIDLFWGLNDLNKDIYIAIDNNRVRINMDSSLYFERDTWYGAKFNKTINIIPDNVSKLRPPLGLEAHRISMFFSNAYSLDTSWGSKDGIKVFQAEEFKNEKVTVNINGEKIFPARYIHAEFDLSQNIFRHFDGAVHFYDENEYYQRRESDLNYNSKYSFQIKSKSRKLFKMNGIIDVETFVLFTSHFFSGIIAKTKCDTKVKRNVIEK